MGSHTTEYGQPRGVAGYTVSFTATTFPDSLSRSLDVYAHDPNTGYDVLLTEAESLDYEPDNNEITEMLELACQEGELSCKWQVFYVICASDHTVVASGECSVLARNEDEAQLKALDWVHDNDPYDDSRIDPIITITDYHRIEVGSEDD